MKMINIFFKNILAVCILSLLAFSSLYALNSAEIDSNKVINFKYNFVESDTLIYKVKAYDSIVVDYGKPLLRERFERIRIVCDSVAQNGHMFLSSELTDFVAYEADNNTKRSERNDCSWLNRKVHIEIDSSGRRYSTKSDNISTPAMTAGSPFQQSIIFPLGKGKAKIKRTWMHSATESLNENSMPVPVIKQSFLYRSHPNTDTLGYDCKRMDYIVSNQGAVKVITQTGKMELTSVIAGFGIADFSEKYDVPVHHLSSQEIKFTMHLKNDKKIPGVQFINSFYTLEKFIPGDRPEEAVETE